MTADATLARRRVVDLKRDLADAEARVAHLERTCPHQFGAVVSDPIIRACGLCGKVEETQETTKHVAETPRFR